MLFQLIAIAISLAATAFGYGTARKYVRDRLKYVDAVQTMRAPVVAGLVGWALFMPLTLLPFVGPLTALLFGVSVGLGVRAGAKDIRVARLTGGY